MQISPSTVYENYDPYFPDQPVVDRYLPVWANLPAFRSKPAFVWAENGSANVTESSILTYEQLNNSVQSISSQLLVPLQRGDTVVILCPPGLQFVEVIFGCQRSGLLGVPIIPPNPSFTNNDYHHLVRVLSQTKPKAAIAHSDYITSVRKYISSHSSTNERLCKLLRSIHWISINELKEKRVNLGLSFSTYNGCKQDDVYLIQYTSGATGIPKPVLVTAGAAAHNVRVARKAYDLHPNSVITSWLPQYHDCGLMFLLLTIVSGATSVLISPSAFIRRPRLWLELISEFKATCTPVPSFTLPLVVKRGGVEKGNIPIKLWSMKNLIIINEPLYKASVDEFVQVFRPFGLNPLSISPSYGLAENCTFVSTAWRSGDNANHFPTYKNLLPSARLDLSGRGEKEDIEVMIVDEETCEPVVDGVEGEIWIASPSNGSGYLDHPSLTRDIFQGRLKNKVSRCFVRTGDRGVVQGEARFLFVTGRSSDVIEIQESGRKVHSHYIETAAYNSCPNLLRAGCLAAFKVSRRTIAIVAEMQRSEAKMELLRKLSEEMRKAVMKEEKVEIGMVVLVKSGNVPKTTSGKIQRWLAKDKLLGGRMNVVLQTKYKDNDQYSSSPKTRGKEMTDNETDGAFPSQSHDATYPSFLSSL
ncbi:uncharacterized protein LOC141715060 [Apium graveolens]|uniref:uncharacterized protein LOC141715060 n=1 Tax=Apium graveolens TaxID=4045 RepID=UPI003D79C44C